jgi:uncharacterized protein (DUF2336 family)
LRRVTDLFLSGAVVYSHEQIELFDDVFQCLMKYIETSAKALLSSRLAPIETAPPLTIRSLAFDDVIEVAAPVLSQSERLDDEALIEAARNKSQAHLMAISTRRVLSDAVTDVLVVRGNDEVIHSTVNNLGAEFSELARSGEPAASKGGAERGAGGSPTGALFALCHDKGNGHSPRAG